MTVGTAWASGRDWQQSLGHSLTRTGCWAGKQQMMSWFRPDEVQNTSLSSPSLDFVAYYQEMAGVVAWKTAFWMVVFLSLFRYSHIANLMAHVVYPLYPVALSRASTVSFSSPRPCFKTKIRACLVGLNCCRMVSICRLRMFLIMRVSLYA